jgi:hypothetical protein
MIESNKCWIRRAVERNLPADWPAVYRVFHDRRTAAPATLPGAEAGLKIRKSKNQIGVPLTDVQY